MNIIILAKNRERYRSGYYHDDIVKAFMRKADCFIYGEGYPNYDTNDKIDDVIKKSFFNEEDIDLVVVCTSWELEKGPNIEESDPHPNINLSSLKVPKVFFLNKEYKKLEKKLDYIKLNNFDIVFTTHHNFDFWEKETGIKFIQLPFGTDPRRFKDFGLQKKYDFGFTGSLHKNYTDIRYGIKRLLFKNSDVKSNKGLSRILRNNPLKEEYKQYNIYWAEWGSRDLFGRSLLPEGERYAKFLNSFKVFLCTPSAIGLIGTRYFECMATKTLIFCPETKLYGKIFEDEKNCVMFKKDLSDFEEKLEFCINNNDKRDKIISRAYNDLIQKNTYDCRIEKVLNNVLTI